MKRFLDTGVLLTAWRGHGRAADMARRLMEDEGAEFVSCENVLLEILPKPTFEKRMAELEFYNQHFAVVTTIEPFSAELGRAAMTLAKRYGLAAGNVLNAASAMRQGADEFVTSEMPGKPLYRIKELRVVSIH